MANKYGKERFVPAETHFLDYEGMKMQEQKEQKEKAKASEDLLKIVFPYKCETWKFYLK